MSTPSTYPTVSSFNQDLNKLNNNAVQGNVNFPPNSAMQKLTGGAKKSKTQNPKKTEKPCKMHLCGRDRVVRKEGTKSFVVINKKKVELVKAKEMDKKFKAKKAAAAAKAKVASKPSPKPTPKPSAKKTVKRSSRS
jgi:hypothetical protein